MAIEKQKSMCSYVEAKSNGVFSVMLQGTNEWPLT